MDDHRAAAGPGGGRTWFLRSDGDDAGAGSTPETAWRTLGRAQQQHLAPGDRLLLRGGDRFSGSLVLDDRQAGDPSRPVVVGSWGTAAATIASSTAPAVLVFNTSGVEVRDLVLRGSGQATRTSAGLSAYSSGPRLSGLVVRGVDVAGFQHGIAVGGAGGGGFSEVLITRSSAHDNLEGGVFVYGPAFDAEAPSYAHHDVRVEHVDASDNRGDPSNTRSHTGSGILLGSVDGGLVEASSAFGNGADCSAPEGPVGIWAYDARAVVIEDSISASNRTGRRDGGGFDLDQNTSDSVLRRNLSYDNDGPGLMLFTAQDNDAHTGNSVIGNVSIGDARRAQSGYGAITVHGRIRSAAVVGNTVLRPGGRTGAPVEQVGDDGVTDLCLSTATSFAPPSGPLPACVQRLLLAHGLLAGDGAPGER